MVSTSEESRAAFEKYLKQRGLSTLKSPKGYYKNFAAALAWDAWRAAEQFATSRVTKESGS